MTSACLLALRLHQHSLVRVLCLHLLLRLLGFLGFLVRRCLLHRLRRGSCLGRSFLDSLLLDCKGKLQEFV